MKIKKKEEKDLKKSNYRKSINRKSKKKKDCQMNLEYSQNWKAFLAKQATNGKEIKKNIKQGLEKKSTHKKKSIGVDKNDESKDRSNSIWFDVDPILIEKECGLSLKKDEESKVDSLNDTTIIDDPEARTKYLALDCEMVGIGYEGKENALARVSIVNSKGQCIYDKYVKPAEKVVDYRTAVSGIRPVDLIDAVKYETVQKEVADILKGRILVGHALHNDLKVLFLSHPYKQIRDTAKYKPFKKLMKTKRPALRKLAAVILQETIQSGEHSSIIDARAAMKIYKLYSKEWEKSLRTKSKHSKCKTNLEEGETQQKKKNKCNKWSKKRQHKKKSE